MRMRFLGRGATLLVAVVAGLLMLGAGIAFAGYDYSHDYAGRILPGAAIGDVEVGGLTPEQALAKVRAAIGPQLTRPVAVRWKGKKWVVTPKELGARSDARAAVQAAVAASSDASFLDKVEMRLLARGLSFEREVAITYPRQGVRGFISGLASSLDRKPRDASLDYSSGWVEVRRERAGRAVQVERARAALLAALRTGDTAVSLPVKRLKPETTADSFDQVLLLRIGENKLYLYDDGEITHEWSVATGEPNYPTPTGQYYVTEKRYLPTWVNPSPDGWGKDLPAEIPPGPNNPLGTRALNWSAPAIRFHGTSATYSIGYNASHGCVRLHMGDVEQLYDLVDVGTPIVSVFVGPWKPLAPPPEVEDDDDKKKKKKAEPIPAEGG